MHLVSMNVEVSISKYRDKSEVSQDQEGRFRLYHLR